MGSHTQKKKAAWHKHIVSVFMALIGVTSGILIAADLDRLPLSGIPVLNYILALFVMFAGIFAVYFLQIAIHETGHLIFGLLSGYRFSSFRLGALIWVKKAGELRCKRLSVAGTGGQCLMSPPDMVNEKIPFVLYNLGGCIFNMFFGLFFLCLYLIWSGTAYLSSFLLLAGILGIAFALMNGIPIRYGLVDNDGYNTLCMGKSIAAIRSYWLQLKTNEEISKGVRIKDLPKEWICIPSADGMQNSMTAAQGVLACNWLMDIHAFEKADRLMGKLLMMDTAIIELHRRLMICDQLYCALIGGNGSKRLSLLLTGQQKKFMKSMRGYPGVLRTEYAYALLAQRDTKQAKKIQILFDQRAAAYPHLSEIESERELMQIAQQAATADGVVTDCCS